LNSFRLKNNKKPELRRRYSLVVKILTLAMLFFRELILQTFSIQLPGRPDVLSFIKFQNVPGLAPNKEMPAESIKLDSVRSTRVTLQVLGQ